MKSRLNRFFFFAFLLLLLTPRIRAEARASNSMELIKVRGTGFVEEKTGREFVPFGFNYFDPGVGWAPKLWRQFDEARVRRHFELMRSIGVNVVRVFLTAASFQPAADAIDETALKKMDAMVAAARANGIRIIFTGPDHWEGVPPYWRPDKFCGEPALAALDRFWSVVAKRYAGDPAIFAWDLLNEPMIPWTGSGAGVSPESSVMNQRWNAWLKTQYREIGRLRAAWGAEAPAAADFGAIPPPEDKPAEGSRRLIDYQHFRESLADAWTARQVAAIRTADPTHPITIGYIQWSYPLLRRPARPSHYAAFNPRRQGRLLDFMSIHFYPQFGDPGASPENARKNREYLQAAAACCAVAGQPVFLQEFGWHGGASPDRASQTPEEARKQAEYLEDVVVSTRRLARGWAGWPFADTLSSRDLTKFAGAFDADLKIKPWGERFKVLASQPLPPLVSPPSIDEQTESAALAAGEETLNRLHEAYVKKIQECLTP